MNELTRKFHEAEFPGWKPKKTYEEIINNFFNSELPFLELDIGLDTTEAMQWIESNKKHFIENELTKQQENDAKKEGKFWYFNKHADGWKQCWKFGSPLLGQDILCISSEEKFKAKELRTFVPDAFPGLAEQLHQKGFVFKKFHVSELLPNGWAQPHMDRFHGSFKKLQWVWIPLNDAQPNLKVYPYGYIKPKVGCLYFFSNMGYVHSIINKDNFSRYVAMGTIDLELSKINFDKIKECVKSQWFNQ